MKKIVIIFLTLFIISCSSEKSTEDIKNEILKYKDNISELNSKISELEEKINTDIKKNNNSLKVTVETVKKEKFSHTIVLNGTVEPVNSAFISSETNGQVKRIYVKEGTHIRKGQLIVSLNSNIMQSSINELKTGLELAKTIFKKQDELWKKNIGSEIQYLKAKNDKESLESKLKTLYAQLDLSKIKAPISGIVDEINIKEGEMAMPGFQIIQLVNLEYIYINVDIPENYISKIKTNDLVKVSVPSYPEYTIESNIYRIGNIINKTNRTFKVQVKIKNKDKKIKPNMIAKIEISDYFNDSALSVSSKLIKEDLKGKYLYIAISKNGKTIAQKQYIETGVSNNTNTVILEGLSAGDKIINKGFSLVKNGKEINIISNE